MHATAAAVSESDRAEAYNRMKAGAYVLAAIPDFQYKWMERVGIDPKTKRTLKRDVTDAAVLAVLNENPYDWSRGLKPERIPTARIEECNSKSCADAMRALIALGYNKREAKKALEGVVGSTAESLVRGALGRLTNTTPQQPVDLDDETTVLAPTPFPAEAVGYAD